MASIAPDDALILPHRANPRWIGFSGTTGFGHEKMAYGEMAGSPGFPQSQKFGFSACRLLAGCRGLDMTAVHHLTDFICPGCGAGLQSCARQGRGRPTSSADPLQSLQTVTGPHRQGVHFEILPNWPQTGREAARLA